MNQLSSEIDAENTDHQTDEIDIYRLTLKQLMNNPKSSPPVCNESNSLLVESGKQKEVKKRGRPPKIKALDAMTLIKPDAAEPQQPEKVVGRKRGRPPKQPTEEYVDKKTPRQKKIVAPKQIVPSEPAKNLKVKLVGRRVGRPSKEEQRIM